MVLTRPRRAVLAAAAALVCAGCGGPGAGTVDSQAGGTLVTYGDAPACPSPVALTGLVTQDQRGCFLLDGRPLVFPSGTTWAGSDGRTVKLPDGAQLRSGALVSGSVCTGLPTAIPQAAQFDCGVDRIDTVRGLVGPVSVQPVGP